MFCATTLAKPRFPMMLLLQLLAAALLDSATASNLGLLTDRDEELLIGALRAVIDQARADHLQQTFNDYVDTVIANLHNSSLLTQLDPFELPDRSAEISKKILFWTWTGSLNLTQGDLTGLASLRRHGDSKFNYKDNIVQIKTQFDFNRLQFSYNFELHVNGMKSEGNITGSISHLRVATYFLVKIPSFNITLQSLRFTDKGYLQVAIHQPVHGMLRWLSWLENVLLSVAVTIFHNPILDAIAQVLTDSINAALGQHPFLTATPVLT